MSEVWTNNGGCIYKREAYVGQVDSEAAQEIVTACNAHDKLKELLKEAGGWFVNNGTGEQRIKEKIQKALEEL